MRRLGLLLAGAVLLAGCGLPLADGVQSPGDVPAEQSLPEPISVLPPGPQPGATPEDIVFGFLSAQSSPTEDHAVARSFLSADRVGTWDDDAGVTVYNPRTATASATHSGEEAQVRLDLEVLGRVGEDGAANVQAPAPSFQGYRLRQVAGQWRLVEVPPGLTLSPAARDRALDPVTVHYLAPSPPGGTRHLVADLVQVPAGGDVRALVERLLAGPSSALAGSVTTAFPEGTRLLSAHHAADGEVVVDLSREVAGLSDERLRELSAQLVWTLRNLRGFSRLRLLVAGRPLSVLGAGEVQPRTAWSGFDPSGAGGNDQPAFALVGGRVRALEPAGGPQKPAAADGDAVPGLVADDLPGVVEAAVAPRTRRLAVLTESGGVRTVRTAAPAGRLVVGAADAGLRSPTWGSGEAGLWVLRTGRDSAVLRVPEGGPAVVVRTDGLPALDSASVLRVSRDGVRVAVVAGGTLLVGRVEPGAAGLPARIVGLRPLATGVLDVAWQTGTSLVVLVRDESAPRLPLLRLDVDGLVASTAGLLGVTEGDPVSLAAYGDAPLLVQTRSASGPVTYDGDPDRGFEQLLAGAEKPFYPG